MGEENSPVDEGTIIVIRRRKKPVSLASAAQNDLIEMERISVETGIKFPIDGDRFTVTPEVPIATSKDNPNKLDK